MNKFIIDGNENLIKNLQKRNLIKNLQKRNLIKNLQKRYLIIAVVLVIISQVISSLRFSYVLGAVGVSILGASNLTIFAIRKYNGDYNFILGAVVGLMISSLPAIIIFNEYSRIGVLLVWVGWTLGGYIGIKDQIKEEFNLQILVYIFWILFLILLGIILTILIFALMMISNTYILVGTFVLVGIFIARYSRKKLLSEYLSKTGYKPNAHGMFGAFVGAIIGLLMSLLGIFIYGYLAKFTINVDLTSYLGLVVGAIVGFTIGNKYKSGKTNKGKE